MKSKVISPGVISPSTINAAGTVSASEPSGANPAPAITASAYQWFDASNTDSITEIGGVVSDWDDQTSNAFHMAQTTGSRQPTLGTTTSGMTSVNFASDFMTSLVSGGTTNWLTHTVIFVGEKAGSSVPIMAIFGAYTPQYYHSWYGSGQSARVSAKSGAYHNVSMLADVALVASTSGVDIIIAHTADYLGANNTGGVAINGAALTTGTTTTEKALTTHESLLCGMKDLDSSAVAAGTMKISEVIVWKSVLSQADIDDVTDWLNTKWSIY